MNNKYRTCKNCGNPCYVRSYVCKECFVNVFKRNRNNCYSNWRYIFMKEREDDEQFKGGGE